MELGCVYWIPLAQNREMVYTAIDIICLFFTMCSPINESQRPTEYTQVEQLKQFILLVRSSSWRVLMVDRKYGIIYK
jgi:hypothetical protein